MVRRSLVACLLEFFAVQGLGAQTPMPLGDASGVGPASKAAQKEAVLPYPVKEFSSEEVDAQVAKAFGETSPEMRRPVRIWIDDLQMALAAQTATLGKDRHSVRFTEVSFGFPVDGRIVRGEEGVLAVDEPLKSAEAIPSRTVVSGYLRTKNQKITLTNFTRFIAIAANNSNNLSGNVSPPIRNVQIRYSSDFDAKALPAEFVPALPGAIAGKIEPVKTARPGQRPLDTDLAKVPEITFGSSIPRTVAKDEAIAITAHTVAKINHLNKKNRDGFALALLNHRADLRGLPFQMGDDCRTPQQQARIFGMIADLVQDGLRKSKNEMNSEPVEKIEEFWAEIAQSCFIIHGTAGTKELRVNRGDLELVHKSFVAALMQILMPESEQYRLGLAKCLATIPHLDATKALAKMAIFSAEDDVRAAAIEGLKLRRERDYTDVLVSGLNYPLPAVAKRAAEAIVKLERSDLTAELLDVLERPDPRLPVTATHEGKDVTTVRELVKINHHRNCLLCHAPGNTDTIPEGVLKVPVPLPTEALVDPSRVAYYKETPATPDILVRVDMTYLRQDFSMMLPVSDAHPWPDMQRFDFLVRQRTLSPAEAKAFFSKGDTEEAGRVPEHHRAALFGLRELTGRDTEPTAAAWRKLLKMPKAS